MGFFFFKVSSRWCFHSTWAAADALQGPTGRTQRRSCPRKLVPAPAASLSLFLSSAVTMAVTSKIQFRRPTKAFGSPGRRPVLAGGNARPPGCPHRGVVPTQVGPGPIRQITTLPNIIKNDSFAPILFLPCPNGVATPYPCSQCSLMPWKSSCKHKNNHVDEGSDGVAWHAMQDETQAFPYRKCLLNLGVTRDGWISISTGDHHRWGRTPPSLGLLFVTGGFR